MPYTILVYNVQATYSNGTWCCDDDPIQALLESLVDPQEVKSGDPLLELYHAHMAAKRLGGRVLGGPYPELEVYDRAEEEARTKAAHAAAVTRPTPRSSGGLGKLLGLVQRKFVRD